MSNRTKGFASMPPEKRLAAWRKGGLRTNRLGKAHRFTRAKASLAGKRSGQARREIRRNRGTALYLRGAKRYLALLATSYPSAPPAPGSGQTAPTDSLLTRGELAAKLGIKPKTLYQWEHWKGLPVVVIAGRRKGYDVTQVSGWLEQCTQNRRP